MGCIPRGVPRRTDGAREVLELLQRVRTGQLPQRGLPPARQDTMSANEMQIETTALRCGLRCTSAKVKE